MEIDKAIREAGDKRLKKKYDNAIYVIQRALALYSLEEIALSFNGGKDSTVLLHLLRAGYYLLKRGESQYLMNPEDDESFPIRTIYFASQSIFPQINSFTYDMASVYKLKLDVIHVDLKSGLEALLKGNPIRAIFLGVRIGDPTAVGQEQFSPSSAGWPPFMRVNPILDWSYRDIWAFLLTCKIQYCSLYDQGYTSIGSVHDTSPNELLYDTTESGKTKYKPAYLLHDGRFERAGRVRKLNSTMLSAVNNGLKCEEPQGKSVLTASIISVGDEILSGCVEDCMGSMLCRKLNSIGWAVSHLAVTQNELDSVADEVEKQKSTADIVFIYGGVGPLHSDVAVAGVAKAFGVRMAPDEEFEEYLRHLIGEKFSGDGNEMAHLPEGITELLHHEKLYVPLIKCENVILFAATNALELENEWDCLIDLMGHNGVLVAQEPFLSTSLETTLSDVVVAQPLSQIRTKFPNLYIGAYRKTREGSLIITIRGKDELRIGAAAEALSEQLSANAQAERN